MAHKTPGKYYRKGMSLIEIFQMFPDDATSEKWFVDVRWPDGVRYPHCGSTNVQTGAKHKTMPYRCRDKVCGKRFSAKSKTLIESANLGYQTCAIVCTDDSKSNRKLHGYDHQFVKHSVGEYVDGEIHINRMESFWSILKRVHQCTFQRFSKKHLDRYVNEFEGKHNIRNTDTIRQMESIARGWWERV